MTKFKEIKKKVKFQIFPHDLHIVVSNDIKQCRSKYDRQLGHVDKNFEAMTVGYGTTTYIFLKHNARPGVIAHEAKHCAAQVLDSIGAVHEEEVEAYIITFIVDQIVDFISEKWNA